MLLALSRNPMPWKALNNGDNLSSAREDFDPPFRTDAWVHLAALREPVLDRMATQLQEEHQTPPRGPKVPPYGPPAPEPGSWPPRAPGAGPWWNPPQPGRRPAAGPTRPARSERIWKAAALSSLVGLLVGLIAVATRTGFSDAPFWIGFFLAGGLAFGTAVLAIITERPPPGSGRPP
ncbi:MAG: hypothetical protein M3Z25_04465 [Actinomycetota bacterium]|nr:hypothetical protein [Actinomycetota bacterium]